MLADLGVALSAWLVTYALHSTVLMGGAWLATRPRAVPDVLRDTLWKTAVVAGLLTSTLPLALGGNALFGLPVARDWNRLPIVSGAHGEAATPMRTVMEVPPVAVHAPGGRRASVDRGSPPPAVPRRGIPDSWPLWMAGVWIAGTVLSTVRIAVAWRRFRAMLGPRREVQAGPLREALDFLCIRADVRHPVRLTCAGGLNAPVALGRGEVCVPPRALVELDAVQQSGMLAHEVGHLLRADPAWLALATFMERVFFFQPMHRIARHSMQEVSERLCDRWAADQTGSPLGLAECLAVVAGWAAASRLPLPVAGMAGSGPSPLVARVQRLLGPPAPRSPLEGPRVRAAACALLVAAATVTPRVSPASPTGRARFAPGTSVASAWSPSSAVLVPLPTPGVDTGRASPVGHPPCGDDRPDVVQVDGEYQVRWANGGCLASVRARPAVSFTTDDDDVASLSPGAFVTLQVRDDGRGRTLEVRGGGGSVPGPAWRVDGTVRPLDERNRGLVRALLPAFVRLSGINARERSRALLRRGGVGALLDEAGRVLTAREEYLSLVLDAGEPDAGSLRRVLELAKAVDGSQAKAALLVRAARARAFAPALVLPLVRTAATVDDDDAMVDALAASAAAGPLPAEARDAFFAAVDRKLDDDGQRGRALQAALGRTPDADLRLRVIRASERIENGGLRAALLVSLVRAHGLPLVARGAYARAAESIESDADRARALAAMVQP